MSHTLLAERPSPARITAIAGVVALHAAAFVLLLMPMAPPQANVDEPDVVPIIWQTIKPKPVVPPTPPVRQERITPTHSAPRPIPREQPPVVVDTGPDVAPPYDPNPDTAIVIETPQPPSGPIRADALEYASAPPPAYPRDAMARRIEGTVILQVLVDVDGTPLDVQVQTSSGNRSLDKAARDHILKRWKFKPAMQDGRAVQAIGIVPVRFVLQ